MGCSQSRQHDFDGDRDYQGIPIEEWKTSHVIEWIKNGKSFDTLGNVQRKELILAIEKQGIPGHALATITEDDLKGELKLPLGTRRTFLVARDILFNNNNNNNNNNNSGNSGNNGNKSLGQHQHNNNHRNNTHNGHNIINDSYTGSQVPVVNNGYKNKGHMVKSKDITPESNQEASYEPKHMMNKRIISKSQSFTQQIPNQTQTFVNAAASIPSNDYNTGHLSNGIQTIQPNIGYQQHTQPQPHYIPSHIVPQPQAQFGHMQMNPNQNSFHQTNPPPNHNNWPNMNNYESSNPNDEMMDEDPYHPVDVGDLKDYYNNGVNNQVNNGYNTGYPINAHNQYIQQQTQSSMQQQLMLQQRRQNSQPNPNKPMTNPLQPSGPINNPMQPSVKIINDEPSYDLVPNVIHQEIMKQKHNNNKKSNSINNGVSFDGGLMDDGNFSDDGNNTDDNYDNGAELINDTDNQSNKPHHRHNNESNHTSNKSRGNNEQAIKEFAKDLWKKLSNIKVKQIMDDNGQSLSGFTGKDLENYIKQHLRSHFSKNELNNNSLLNKEISNKCQKLLDYKFIKPMSNNNNNNNNKFSNSSQYLYQFNGNKHKMFIKEEQPDRRAWTRGTKVKVNSTTFKSWVDGTIIDVNHDTLSITYGVHNTTMKKQLDRYADDLVKSTDEFIKIRKSWKKGDNLEVYSQGQHMWCQTGKIDEVLQKNKSQKHDIFRVFYTNSEGKDFSKYLDRWSPFLRAKRKQVKSKYSKGTKILVFSNTQKKWVKGHVIDTVANNITVRYGDHEKLVPITSDAIKLIDDNNSTKY